MFRSILIGVLAASLSGCATFTVVTPQKEAGPDYIVLKTIGNREKIYDCYSKPGDVWDPTCVLVKYRQSGIAQERRAIRKEDQVDDYEEKRRRK
jgi:hypothetical protein